MNKHTTIEKYFLWSHALYAFSFPFPEIVFNICLGIWILMTLLWMANTRSFSWAIIKKNKVAIGILGLYGSTLIGLTHTSDMPAGLFLIERLSLFLLAPILMSGIYYIQDKKKLLQYVHWGFILGSFAILLAGIGAAIYRLSTMEIGMFDGGWAKIIWRFDFHFTYQVFAKGAGMHAIYFSIYLVLGFFMVLEKRKDDTKLLPWQRKLLNVIAVFFFAFIFLLKSANISFGFIILLALYFLFNNSIQKSNMGRWIVGSGVSFLTISSILLLKANHLTADTSTYLFIGVSAVVGLAVPYITLWIQSKHGSVSPWLFTFFIVSIITMILILPQLKSLEGWAKENPSNVSARYWNWRSATDLIFTSPILGLGAGESSEALVKKYHQYQFEGGMNHHYNEHSQYLRTWLDSGLLGLFFLLFILFHMYRGSMASQYFPFLVITILFMLVSVTESVLTRRSFICLFSYFALFYSYTFLDKKNPLEKPDRIR